MEKGKVNWLMLEKPDRLRTAHAQKIVNNPSNPQAARSRMDSQGMVCNYFQTGKCPHKSDHTTTGQLYNHICSHFVNLCKCFAHSLKDCRNKKENHAKNE